jgi:tetratricopeptide (TPR) repeat protein
LIHLAVNSAHLTADQVRRMETSLYTSPNDAATRAKLLGYYFLRQAESIRPRLQHVLWMIQNRPADPFTATPYCRVDPDTDAAGYAQVIALWQQVLAKNPDNPAILRNAASACAPADDTLAEQWLRHGSELEPKNADWPSRLAELYEVRMIHAAPDSRAKAATDALAQRQKAFDLEKNAANRFAIFTQMPRDAYESGDTIKAKHLAQQLLGMAENFRKDWNYGNAIHVANIVLGRVALRAGDIEAAKTDLQAAGQTPGSPQLDSFGPDMTLAQELLQHGQRQAVHDYLDACGKFWTAGTARLKSWTATVDAGGTPDFGPQAGN